MKFISLIFFALATTGTWMATHAKRAVEQSVHIGIQNDLKRIITEYVKGKLPDSKNLVFEKFYTKTINAGQVVAFFNYAFEDKTEDGEPARVEIEGSATLNKIEETAEASTWNLDQLKILNNKVDFTEPIQITAGRGGAPTEPTSDDKATDKSTDKPEEAAHQ